MTPHIAIRQARSCRVANTCTATALAVACHVDFEIAFAYIAKRDPDIESGNGIYRRSFARIARSLGLRRRRLPWVRLCDLLTRNPQLTGVALARDHAIGVRDGVAHDVRQRVGRLLIESVWVPKGVRVRLPKPPEAPRSASGRLRLPHYQPPGKNAS